MEYDREAARRRRDYQKALAARTKLEEKLARLNRETRNAKSRLLATTKSEQWHRMTLGWLDREAGYTGEMASARVWLREQPIQDYVQLLVPFAHAMHGASSIAIEVAAVRANLEDWTTRGDALLLDRARQAYADDLESFRQWQRDNPNQEGWRRKPATRAQGFLVSRTAAALGIDPPRRMTRGDAFDWIDRHGGNLRLNDRGDGSAGLPVGTDDVVAETGTPNTDGTPTGGSLAGEEGGAS